MAQSYSELLTLTPEELNRLIGEYYVRTHNGEEILQGESQINFILNWLASDYTEFPVLDSAEQVYQAIQQGRPFDPESASQTEVLDMLLGGRVLVNSNVLEDFGYYPIQTSFGRDAWELFQGYLNSNNRKEYFEGITGAPASDFLNETERLFYLTRGYGRPNKYISKTDLNGRQFIQNSAPTALVVLSDLLGVCPTLQDPNTVLEGLSSIDLRTIDSYYHGLMERINECLGSKRLCQGIGRPLSMGVCDPQSCPEGRQFYSLNNCDMPSLMCFRDLLNSIGALNTVEYDPTHNVFISNLSQAGLYRDVVLDKNWSMDEVQGLPDVCVESTLKRLPDQELLKIKADGMTLLDEISLDDLNSRLRENLLKEAGRFLTKPRFLIDGQQVKYGRLVDEVMDEYPLTDLLRSIRDHGALIDPQGHALTLEEAEALPENDVVSDVLYRTRAAQINNLQYLSGLLPSERDGIFQLFNSFLADGLTVDELGQALEELPVGSPLILWDQRLDYIPVAMNFQEYFKDWSPDYRDLIESTADYYRRSV